MKKQIKKIVPIICLVFFQQNKTQELFGKTFFSKRSQTINSVRRLISQHPYMHKTEDENFYGTVSATAEYLRSFKTRRIAEYFFGTDTINFSGSLVANRKAGDILADYFGMSPTFKSSLKLDPQVRSFVMDFNFYFGLDNLYPGIYLQASVPAVWTKHWICLDENIFDNGMSTEFPALYMDTNALTAPATSAKKYFEGNLTYGHVKEGINFGKIGTCERTGVSELWLALGWDFIRRRRGHVGFNLQFAAPTGSKPNGIFMFESQVGNGHHWEFGLGFTGKLLLWEKDGEQTVTLNVDTNFTHLFKSRQCRTFDFETNGFASRYILLKEFDATGVYTGTCIPAINKTTLACDVWASLQMDLTFMASYHSPKWTVDFGYNGWIKTREKICLIGKIEENKYALKGIQNVAGATENSTQSSATLHGNTLDPTTQLNVSDSPLQIFIKTSDIDLCSASTPLSITHKLFTHATYSWNNEPNQTVIPYLGLGFSIEFEGVRHNEAAPDKNTLSLFAMWLKGGVAF